MALSLPDTQRTRVSFERERGIYALEVIPDIAQVRVLLSAHSVCSEAILHTFRVLADAQTAVFLIKIHPDAVTFALAGATLPAAFRALQQAGLEIQSQCDLAMIVLKSAAIVEIPYARVTVSQALSAVGAHLVATGDSHDSLQCLIEAHSTEAAVRRLCAAFQLDSDCVRETPLGPVFERRD